MKFLPFWSLKVSPPGTAKDLKVLVSIVKCNLVKRSFFFSSLKPAEWKIKGSSCDNEIEESSPSYPDLYFIKWFISYTIKYDLIAV